MSLTRLEPTRGPVLGPYGRPYFGVLMTRIMNFREGLTRGLAQLRAFHGMRVETGARSGTAGCQTGYGRTTSPPQSQQPLGRLQPQHRTETGLLADAFAGHGFQLSFGSRKTAATLSFRGPGERIPCLRQLVGHALDALWALIRADGPCLGVLRDALVWLHDRVKATFALPHPLEQWDPWRRACLHRRGLFRGLVKRAKSLLGRYCTRHKVIRSFCDGESLHEHIEQGQYIETCLVCRKALCLGQRGRVTLPKSIATESPHLCSRATTVRPSPGDAGGVTRNLRDGGAIFCHRANAGHVGVLSTPTVKAVHERQPPLTLAGVLRPDGAVR